MKDVSAIVLGAGLGTRMKSKQAKVLHAVCGQPILFYPLEVLKGLRVSPVLCVVGHEANTVKAAFPESENKALKFVLQRPQLGTGHAVMCALKSKALKGLDGDILILSGDVPLITARTIKALARLKRKDGSAMAFVSAVVEAPDGYGRVRRDDNCNAVSIVEDKDASRAERRISEINCGLYLINADFLRKNIKKLGKKNQQGEYYLPDLVNIASLQGKGVSALTLFDPTELMGVNNRVELARASAFMRERINKSLMLSGVTIIDPSTTYIDFAVSIGPDTTIHPGVHLTGKTSIGTNCVILPNSIIESSKIGDSISIGPFARIRPGSVIDDGASIGNFVEVKNSHIGQGTKAGHLSYLGDALVGAGVNIGAGTITCNYDGYNKFKTTIKDNVFIGSDSQLIAPVTIEKGAYVGSGSTIVKDVPSGALALTRVDQKHYKGWVKKKNKKKSIVKTGKLKDK